ncbi:MAG: hypothetical protein OEW77_05245 [Gemmatimonadota bacterium]|nr:hypothetical protein [Gemmatimonadota bacterium]
MVSRGFLIRFIDIGLIAMFGFIQISDIESLAQVELQAAAPAATGPQPAGRPTAMVVVTVSPEGRFAVSDAATGAMLAEALPTTALLTAALRTARDERVTAGREMIVLIRPHEASVVQRTVDVMDACDRLAVRKSLETDLRLQARP